MRGAAPPTRLNSHASELALIDPYLAGLDVLAQIGAQQDDLRNRAAEVAPEFMRLAIGFTYGEIFTRPGLDLKSRLIAAIAAESATGKSPDQLREHVQSALHLGWSEAEIVEVIVQIAAHAGVAAAIKALSDCHTLLAVADPCAQSCAEPNEDTGQR